MMVSTARGTLPITLPSPGFEFSLPPLPPTPEYTVPAEAKVLQKPKPPSSPQYVYLHDRGDSSLVRDMLNNARDYTTLAIDGYRALGRRIESGASIGLVKELQGAISFNHKRAMASYHKTISAVSFVYPDPDKSTFHPYEKSYYSDVLAYGNKMLTLHRSLNEILGGNLQKE
jgi:hypothetical protein